MTAHGLEQHRRVLIVDDVHDITETLTDLVEVLGHAARCANHGDEAVEVAREFRPDLILLDLGMPDPDGFEVARRLRAQPETRDAEIVAVSGWGHERARAQAIHAGFDRHFLKPLTLAHLRALLASPRKGPRSAYGASTS